MKAQEFEITGVFISGSDKLEGTIGALSNEEEDGVARLEHQDEQLGRKRLGNFGSRGLGRILHKDIMILWFDQARRDVGTVLGGGAKYYGISNSGAEVGFPDDFVNLPVSAEFADLDKAVLSMLAKVSRSGSGAEGFPVSDSGPYCEI